MISEEFICHVWKFQNFSFNNLPTLSGKQLQIRNTGIRNTDAGPDFLQARIFIQDTEWAGSVEMHLKSSDWFAHGHHRDKNYNSVILHIVYEADREKIFREDGTEVEQFVIRDFIHPDVFEKYKTLQTHKGFVPCENLLPLVREITIKNRLQRLLIERLHNKYERQTERLRKTKSDWIQLFFEEVAQALGYSINKEPMQELAQKIDFRWVLKYHKEILKPETLFFGTAGFLEEIPTFVGTRKWNDEYIERLKPEWKFLKAKHGITPMDFSQWKFLRLHPPNFPTIRLSQLAMLFHTHPYLWEDLGKEIHLGKWKRFFDVPASSYWNTHFIFGKKHSSREKSIGKDTIERIIINTVIPLLFNYFQKNSQSEEKCERLINLYEKINPEKNSLISQWREIGIRPKNAGDTQALLELKKNFCDGKKCLDCALGQEILSASGGLA